VISGRVKPNSPLAGQDQEAVFVQMVAGERFGRGASGIGTSVIEFSFRGEA
jgi:hypothetical protein